MPFIIVGAPFGLTGPHRQQRRGAIQRLNLRLLVDREHHGVLRRVHVQPDDIAYFGHQQRIGRQLEALAAMRLQSKARQIRLMAMWLKPVAWAIVRVLQWVAPRGALSKVRITTCLTASSPIRAALRGGAHRTGPRAVAPQTASAICPPSPV